MKSTKPSLTTNAFYTLGFLLLYAHVLMNIIQLATRQSFYQAQSKLTITPFGVDRFTVMTSFEELILLGGFVFLTLIGLITESIRAIRLSKNAEPGWKYRNKVKSMLAIIAILAVIWTTIHGYIAMKTFDWVWLSGSLVICIYSIVLMFFPKIRNPHKKAK